MPPATRTLVALVENKSGVLNRIASLFRRRRFNIESLTVGHSEKRGLSRMTIVVEQGTDIDKVFRQMYKIVEVIKIKKLDETQAVIRDLALVKVRKSPGLTKVLKKFKARTARQNGDFVVVEICAEPEQIEKFIAVVKKFGILEVSRAGATALSS
ncbi:MAG: acetolactate synthase small subunit [Candidatus Peribacteraceae bacterium]|nr:acetolactate synthase small subunit [Candidatus Peribacteraceae bacterium]